MVQKGLDQVRDLMNGCSEARYEEIDTMYNGDYEESMAARRKEFPDWEMNPPKSRSDRTTKNESVECEDPAVSNLRSKLKDLERLPENEAVAFQLETEIYKLEREADVAADEWPDEISVIWSQTSKEKSCQQRPRCSRIPQAEVRIHACRLRP